MVKTILRCRINGCTQTKTVEGAASPNATFLCKNHPREEQLEALGRVYHPERDEKDADVSFQFEQFDENLRRSHKPIGTEHIRNQGSEVADTYAQLREFVEGTGGFMVSHQIIKIRRPRKKMPAWVVNENQLRAFLLFCFPRINKDLEQRSMAGRWLRIIQLYFREGWSRGQIAEEMNLTYSTVNSTIRNIKRAATRKRMDGSGTLRHARIKTSLGDAK